MTTPEKRWQLLLVADDGRIIPFKHIKGIALTLLVLLIVAGVGCAGLGWLLTEEKISHRQTIDQLALAREEAARYQSENEIVITELILAEARMKKAGLPVPDRQLPTALAKTEQTADAPQTPNAITADEQEQRVSAANQQSALVQASERAIEPTASAVPEVARRDIHLERKAPTIEPPTIAVGEMKLDHSASQGRVKATFRVSNTGPRSSPVKGWCVVALKSDPADADTWMGLPDDALVDGKIDPKKGNNFRISRFIDMDMETTVGTRSDSFTTATVYVFDDAGAILLEKDFPIALSLAPSGSETAVGGEAAELTIAVDRFKIQYDTSTNILRAMFQVSNTGSSSSPVTGRCVVVLKNEQISPETWLALPDGAMMSGKPYPAKGKLFKISRFKNMTIEASTENDPSVFDNAVVYVFGMDGGMLLEKAYPVRLNR